MSYYVISKFSLFFFAHSLALSFPRCATHSLSLFLFSFFLLISISNSTLVITIVFRSKSLNSDLKVFPTMPRLLQQKRFSIFQNQFKSFVSDAKFFFLLPLQSKYFLQFFVACNISLFITDVLNKRLELLLLFYTHAFSDISRH